jgi:hypothetical protein
MGRKHPPELLFKREGDVRVGQSEDRKTQDLCKCLVGLLAGAPLSEMRPIPASQSEDATLYIGGFA